MKNDPAISWLPAWLPSDGAERVRVVTRGPRDRETAWTCVRPSTGKWSNAADGLRRAGAQLKALPVASIVTAIDRVAARWGDRAWAHRRSARERIAEATGFSAEAVDVSLDVELRNYRADSLWRTLRRELSDPKCLDAFCANEPLLGRTIAIGPELVAAIFTGNVPGLPALSIVRSLLVKAPLIAKVASGEPSFAAAFVESLAEELPAFGDALLITYWGRDEDAVRDEVLRQADVVIAYGGDAACRAIRGALPATARLVEHAHKLSFGYVSERYVAETGIERTAALIARDVATFNQQACIAPQAYFAQGDPKSVHALGEAVASALRQTAQHNPVGELPVADAARVRLERAEASWRAIDRPAAHHAWFDDRLEWSVVMAGALTTPDGIGNRFLRLIPVVNLDGAIAQLLPFKRYLQNVGLGCVGDEFEDGATRLAALGASRISDPGRMADPSMMWSHDGYPRVAELVRWCDIEMHGG